MWNHNYYVYIVTNFSKSVLYIGVTNDLRRRLYEHAENRGEGHAFTSKYYCHFLLYYEHFSHIESAIQREKEMKKWRREKKMELIKGFNPDLRFLNEDV